MKRRIPAVLALVSLVAGCAPEIIPYRSQASIERSYRAGERRVARAGDSLLVLREMTSAPQYEVAVDYAPPQHDLFRGGLDYPPLRRGMRFVQTATRGDGAIGLVRSGYGVTRPGNFTNRETYLPVTIWITKEGVVDGSMEGRSWTTDALFLPTASASAPREALRTEIVLDAIDGALADATYREYDGAAATPTVERRMRLQAPGRHAIGHEGLAIEIDAVTASQVEYRVVEGEGEE